VTLVELMLVVLVMSVLATAFGTSVSRTIIEQRMAGAAREVVRVMRDAKLKASVLRVAHAVVVDPATVSVRTLWSDSTSCLLPTLGNVGTAWSQIDSNCTAASATDRATGKQCLVTNFSEPPWTYPSGPAFRLRELLISPDVPPKADSLSAAMRTICFSPNGTLYHGRGSAPLTDANSVAEVLDASSNPVTLGGGFLFQIDMLREGESEPKDFVSRQVLVPLNGMAKVIR
jgi:type II secretory pathway pseudopilin PulG